MQWKPKLRGRRWIGEGHGSLIMVHGSWPVVYIRVSPTEDCRLKTDDSRLQTPDFPLPTKQISKDQRCYNGSIALDDIFWCIDIQFTPGDLFIGMSA